MAQSATSVQEELDSVLDDIAQAKAILDDAYQPEATREDLAKAIGDALEVLEDYESESDDESDYDEAEDLD